LVRDGVKQVRQYALRRNIETQPAFSDTFLAFQESPENPDQHESAGQDSRGFPNARALLLRCLKFPLYPSLAQREVQLISKVLSTLP
jgi:dTDP-4-amino-4,6-dideoxygalactose transaminase